jgi:hypothetical protein
MTNEELDKARGAEALRLYNGHGSIAMIAARYAAVKAGYLPETPEFG